MRAALKALAILIILALIVWIGLWWYAQTRLEQGLRGWIARMQTSGDIKVAYDGITRGVSPFAARATFNNLQISIQPAAAAAPVTINMPTLGMHIDIASPNTVHIDIPPQLTVDTPRADAAVTFGSINVAEKLDWQAAFNRQPAPFTGSSATASDINILASSGSLLILHIDSLALHGTVNRNAGAGQTAFAMDDAISGIALSPILTRLASIPFGGKITTIGLTLGISGPIPADWQKLVDQFNALPASDRAARDQLAVRTVHDWASKGGSANASLALILGPSTLNANGNVKFGPNAQPAGTARITADHLDAFSAAITNAYPMAQNSVNTLEARLSPYLTTTDAGGQTLSADITYGQGSVTINGQTSPLPPINWTQLENPPPRAPGDGSAP